MPGLGKSGISRISSFRLSKYGRLHIVRRARGRRGARGANGRQRTEKEFNCCTAASRCSTPRTSACEGPRCRKPARRSSCSLLPTPYTCTRPSSSLRTHPRMPIALALFWTNQRKPTPCTRPETNQVRASRVSRATSACGRFRRGLGVAAVQHIPHDAAEALQREGLGNEGEAAFDHVFLDDLAVVVSRHEEHADVRIEAEKMIHQRRSTHAGHHHIRQDKIRPSGHSFECANRILSALGEDDLISLFEKNRLNQTKHIRLIVYNQDCPLCAEIICTVTHTV